MIGDINMIIKLNLDEITERYNRSNEDMLYIYENATTYDFLQFKLGMKPSKEAIEILEFMLIDKNIPPSIVNAFVDYDTNINKNLNKEHLVELSDKCIENSILTTKEVMEYLKTDN